MHAIPPTTIYEYAIEIRVKGEPLERKLKPEQAKEILNSDEVKYGLGAARDTFVYDRISLFYLTNSFQDANLHGAGS